MLDITKDIQSLTTFRRSSADFIKQLKKTKRPVVLTVNGKAAAVVQDAAAYQRLLDIAAGADAMEGIRQGWTMLPTGAHGLWKRHSKEYGVNMAYRVESSVRAVLDLDDLYVEKKAAESKAAARWFNNLETVVLNLQDFPYRCPLIPEAGRLNRELRQLLYGKKPHVYRVIFQVDEKTQTVHVLHIRHGARSSLSLGKSDEALSYVITRRRNPFSPSQPSNPNDTTSASRI